MSGQSIVGFLFGWFLRGLQHAGLLLDSGPLQAQPGRMLESVDVNADSAFVFMPI